MPPAWDIGCHYPNCGGGSVVGKKFCVKHVKTPFETKAEVNAYRRAQKEVREDLSWLLVTLEQANEIIVGEGLDDDHEAPEIRSQMVEIRKRWRVRL